MSTELWQASAVELAGMIRSGRASSREVIEAHLARIDDVNPAVNAVTGLLSERARDEAEAADRAVAAGGELPPLHGVPFTVKENIDLVGTATSQGAKVLAGAYPTLNAPVVERLRAAGAIPIGRTNLPTLGIGWVCESEISDATANPWDASRTPGASSGGEAAALCTGMSPLGLGNHGLGSLRWPAQCCGIAALRPTLGRVPRATTVEPVDSPISVQLVEVDGPLARRVGDLRAAFEVLAGPSWRDPWSVPAPLRGPKAAGPQRVALVIDPARQGVSAQVQDGLRKAASALAEAGYAVDEVEPPGIDAAARTALEMLAPDWRAASGLLAAVMPTETQRVWQALLEVAGDPDPLAVTQSYMTRQSLLRAWGEFQQHHPLMLAPISTDAPFASRKGVTADEVAEILHGLRMTIAINALGLPAVAVPVGLADGLPQSVQVTAARYREDLCLDAAAAVEASDDGIAPIDPR